MRTIWHTILWLDRLSIRAIARQAHHWLLRRHWMIRATVLMVPVAALSYYRGYWGFAMLLGLLSLFFLQHGARNDPERLRRLDELDALDALAELERDSQPPRSGA